MSDIIRTLAKARDAAHGYWRKLPFPDAPPEWGGRPPIDGVSSLPFSLTSVGPSWGNVYGNASPMSADDNDQVSNYAEQTAARSFRPVNRASMPVVIDGKLSYRDMTRDELAGHNQRIYDDSVSSTKESFKKEQDFVRHNRQQQKWWEGVMQRRASEASAQQSESRAAEAAPRPQKWGW